jgi:hypothetical protein
LPSQSQKYLRRAANLHERLMAKHSPFCSTKVGQHLPSRSRPPWSVKGKTGASCGFEMGGNK